MFHRNGENYLDAKIKHVACVLQSLGGHLHGEYVVHAILRDRTDLVTKIECTLPKATFVYAPRVIATIDGIKVSEDGACEYDEGDKKVYRIKLGSAAFDLCQIDMAQFYPNAPNADLLPGYFDWNMMSICNDRMYVKRPFPECLENSSEVLTILIQRIVLGRFCLSSIIQTSDTTGGLAEEDPEKKRCRARFDAEAIRKSIHLIENGWAMDDWLLGSKGWVVSPWKSLHLCRILLPKIHAIKQHDHCPLCHEMFGENDLVVNLPCNHNFHARCNVAEPRKAGNAVPLPMESPPLPPPPPPPAPSGLQAWLSHGNISCPCCRASVRV